MSHADNLEIFSSVVKDSYSNDSELLGLQIHKSFRINSHHYQNNKILMVTFPYISDCSLQ